MAEPETQITDVQFVASKGVTREVKYAAMAGVVAGIPFGLVAQALGLMSGVGFLFTLGTDSAIAGWGFHMFFSAVFGGLWGAITEVSPGKSFTRNAATGITLGGFYGFLLWFVNVGFIVPLWVRYVMGVGGVPFPWLFTTEALMPLLGHLLWGAIFGLTYPVARQ